MRCFTPLGKGKVVKELPDGRLLVEFVHGGFHVFFKSEVSCYGKEFLLRDLMYKDMRKEEVSLPLSA